jgi:hypothetical protein
MRAYLGTIIEKRLTAKASLIEIKKFLHGKSDAAFLCLERDDESSYLGIRMPAVLCSINIIDSLPLILPFL